MSVGSVWDACFKQRIPIGLERNWKFLREGEGVTTYGNWKAHGRYRILETSRISEDKGGC